MVVSTENSRESVGYRKYSGCGNVNGQKTGGTHFQRVKSTSNKKLEAGGEGQKMREKIFEG